MTVYTFAFVIDRQPTAEDFAEPWQSDMIFGTEGPHNIAEFDREASDLVGAISSAIVELALHGIKVLRMVEPEDFHDRAPSWRPARIRDND